MSNYQPPTSYSGHAYGGPPQAYESFTRNVDGSRTCNDCGKTFQRADGSVMRSHRRNTHGEYHYTPAVCNA